MPESFRERVTRFLVGPDAFISYSRRDAFEYAGNLASMLGQKHLRVYIDQVGAPPGKCVPASILRAAKRASVLVLVESPAAYASAAVGEEIATFPYSRRPLIRIQFDESSPSVSNGSYGSMPAWFESLGGIAIQRETLQKLELGTPSLTIVDRIDRAVGNQRQASRLRRAGAAAGIVLSIGVLILIAMTAQLFRIRSESVLANELNARLTNRLQDINRDLKKGQSDLQNTRIQVLEQESALAEARRRTASEIRRASDQFAATEAVWRVIDEAVDGVQRELPQPDLNCAAEGWRPSLDRPFIVLFTPDHFEFTEAAREALIRFAGCCKRLKPAPVLTITGHVDLTVAGELGLARSVPGGSSAEYALGVGDRLSSSVKEFLATMGMSADRMRTTSMGKERPRFPSRVMNNRVEITFEE